MSDGSKIEWCDATWQPVLGCTRVSAGCDNCYAIRQVHRQLTKTHQGLTKMRVVDPTRPLGPRSGPDWNGTVRLQPEKLSEPIRWQRSRRVFVCSLADLFHPKVPFTFIHRVFQVMADCERHTFLVLTKRPERAREFFAWLDPDPAKMTPELLRICAGRPWPLSNVCLGTSVEDQATADERIPHLLQCPAAVRWVSLEPQLEHVWLAKKMESADGTHAWMNAMYHLDWVVVGGESGPRARLFCDYWARSILAQRVGLRTKVFVKQLGSYVASVLGGDRKGGDMTLWPRDLRVREFPT